MTNKEEYLISMLNSVVKSRDITYGEFNHLIPFGEYVQKLRDEEEKYPELGIARYETEEEGISTLTIIASITDVLIGKRLGVNLGGNKDIPIKDRLITGFSFIKGAID